MSAQVDRVRMYMAVDALISTLSPEAQALRHDPGFRAFVAKAISDPENCRANCEEFFWPRGFVRQGWSAVSMESSAEYQRD